MAEVCSSFPTAGGLYYWSAKLARKNAAAWSWFIGWFNLFGQVAVTAGIDFGPPSSSTRSSTCVRFDARPWHTILLFGLILLLHGLLNHFGVRLVARLNDIVWRTLIGVAIIFGVLFFVPSHHQSASFVFTKFVNNTGFNAPFYVSSYWPLARPVHVHRLRLRPPT